MVRQLSIPVALVVCLAWAPAMTAARSKALADKAGAGAAKTQEKAYTMEDFGPWNADVAKVHVPQITFQKVGKGLTVTVKVDDHPMDPKTPHYIEWIRLEDGSGKVLGRKAFKPTDPAPIATFKLKKVPTRVQAFDRCNIHGVWTNQADVPQ